MAKLYKRDDGSYLFFCPGCEEYHAISVEKPFGNGSQWTFNGDIDKPTFNPSYLVHPNTNAVCHSFIKDGYIDYCSDSKHSLSGKKVELPEIDI